MWQRLAGFVVSNPIFSMNSLQYGRGIGSARFCF
jgi:hypothetical protein